MEPLVNPLGLIFLNSGWEEEFMMKEIQEDYIPDTWGLTNEDYVIEIGGHVGEVSMTIARKYGAQVFVFEPSPPNYQKLMKNIAVNKLGHLITVFPLAVTGDGRDVRMHLTQNSGAHRIYGSKQGPIVKSVTLAQAFQKCNQIKPPRLLIMDCEGAEFEILQDVGPLQGIRMIRGELHEAFGGGNIDELLERIKTMIPDALFCMTYKGETK
jgi:FkbM family methyltransferase